MIMEITIIGWFVSVFLTIVAPWCALCRRRANAFDEAFPPGANNIWHVSSQQVLPEENVPEKSIDSGWVFAFLTLLPFVPLLLIHSYIWSLCFETLYDRKGGALFEPSFMNNTMVVTDFDLLGVGLATAWVFLAGCIVVLLQEEQNRGKRVICNLAIIIGIIFLTIEAMLSYQMGVSRSGAGLVTALVSVCLSGIDALLGGFAIHRFTIPFASGAASMVSGVGRGVGHWMTNRRIRRQAQPKIGVFTRLGAHMDEAVFDPLRTLDGLIASFLSQKVKGKIKSLNGQAGAIVVLLLAAPLLVGFSTMEKPALWVVGIDVTESIPVQRFEKFKKDAKAILLPRLIRGDLVFVMAIGPSSHTGFTLNPERSSLFEADIAKISDQISQLKQVKGGYTDIAYPFAMVREYIDDNRGLGSPLLPIRMLIFSDGIPTGVQQKGPEDSHLLEVDWRLAFIGLEKKKQTKETIEKLAAKFGFQDTPGRVAVVSSNLVEMPMQESVGKFIGLDRKQNTDIERILRNLANSAKKIGG